MPGFLSKSANALPVWIADDDGNPVAIGSGGSGGGGVVTQPTASNLNAQVVGNVANGTTDAGNPIKVGGVVNSSVPTALTSGQRSDLWVSASGAAVIAGLGTIGTDAISNNSMVSLVQNNGAGRAPLVVSGYVFNGTTHDRQRGDTNGTYSVSKGSGSIATAQVSVGTASTQIVAARAGRGAVTITNLGTTDIFIGVTGVTATTGTLLLGSKGASITIPTNAAVFGIAATAQSVSVLEVF